MLRAFLIPAALVAIPAVRLLALLLIPVLLFAAFGGYLTAQQTGGLGDWASVACYLLGIGALRWLRFTLRRAQNALLV